MGVVTDQISDEEEAMEEGGIRGKAMAGTKVAAGDRK